MRKQKARIAAALALTGFCCIVPCLLLLCAAQGVENAEVTIPLRIAGLNVPSDLTVKYPHLYGCTHLELDDKYRQQVTQGQGARGGGRGGQRGCRMRAGGLGKVRKKRTRKKRWQQVNWGKGGDRWY